MSEKYPGGFVTYNPPTPSQTSATGIWTLSQQEQYQQAGLWPNSPSQVSRSLRFNVNDTTFLSRTPTYAGNRQTWTWSAWIKLGQLSILQYGLFSARSGTDFTRFTCGLYNDNTFLVSDISSSNVGIMDFQTTQVFRDPSAWYHFVMAVDTTQATNTNRFKLYVNGVQVTSFISANYPAQNANTGINAAIEHNIGKYALTGNYVDGYMANVQFVDGQALTPTSFGEYNANTGVWQPLQKNLTYGTNGFQLTFNDNTNTTATTLGADSSGNGNNFTPSNFSVTTGAGNDSMVDSPTSYGTDTGVGGTVRGNYGTLNPLFNATTLTNGNLDTSLSSASVTATFGSSSGQWYFECTITAASGTAYLGIADQTLVKSDGSFSYSQVYVYLSSSYKGGNGSSSVYGSTYTTGDVIGVAYDLDAGSITFYKNGTSQGVAFNTGFTAGYIWRPFLYFGSGSATFNFGQRPFAYTAPSGYKALCTQNLPTPTIGATSTTLATKYFNPVTYTATGNDPLSVTGVGFQPDFTWIKSRSAARDNVLFDAVRGATKYIVSNSTGAEATNTSSLKSFDSDGFTLGSWPPTNWVAGDTQVSWNWKANGSGSTNTAGSITSTVSANTTSGFSVVTYTGNGTQPSTVGHGLGVAPSFVIVKTRDSASYDWNCYHISLGNTQYIALNTAAAASSAVSLWNNTTPTSTVFTVNHVAVNTSGNTYVAYCFAEVAGYSKIGSYTGTGATNGPFIYCGFRPAYLLIKNSNVAGQYWDVYDNKRNTYNPETLRLFPNASDAEGSATQFDFLSNGFKVISGSTSSNGSGNTIIYMAFAESPFKYSLAR